MSFDFAVSNLMVGSMVPGERQQIQRKGVVNFPDGSNHPLIKKREHVDPMVRYPSMNQEHTSDHPFMKKLRDMMGVSPQMKHGYEPIRENRDWRRF